MTGTPAGAKSNYIDLMSNNILFITKNYPPKIGGLEKFSYDLIKIFSKNVPTYKITLSKPLVHLLWFLPYALFKSLFLIKSRNIKHVHLCDASLSPLGIIIKKITGVFVSTTAAGLDITYNNQFYQFLIPHCLRKLDKIIPISTATKNECLRRNLPPEKMSTIPVGIYADEISLDAPREQLRSELEQLCNCPLKNRVILTTVGRLVERKGVYWFINNVMPALDSRFHYIVAGEGPDYERIIRLIQDLNLQDRITLTGRIPDETKKILLNAADIFIMPNIYIPGDVEGFGIVAIEAGACGTPVIASGIQGIRDAVIDGLTGKLVEEKNENAFVQALLNASFDRERVKNGVINTYDWHKIYYRYTDVLFNS